MKNIWKWILGILLILVVVGGLFAAGYFMWRTHNAAVASAAPFSRSWNGPMMPGRNGNRGQVGPGYGFGPMMGGRGFNRGWGGFLPFGFGGFFLLGGLFRLLLPLGFIALVAYLFYQIGKQAGAARAVPPAVPPAPVDAEPAPVKTE